MNVLVLGGSGKTGSMVVERALAAGHQVTMLVRNPAFERAGVRICVGDTSDPVAVRSAVSGQDAVIDTIGGKTPYKSTDLETVAAGNTIAAMQAEGIRRLIVVSMMGLGESAGQAPFWYRYLLMNTFLRGSTPDKRRMEAAVQLSGLDFVIVRPPILADDPPKGTYTVVPAGSKAHKITRGDLASFLISQLSSNAHLGQCVVVANS